MAEKIFQLKDMLTKRQGEMNEKREQLKTALQDEKRKVNRPIFNWKLESLFSSFSLHVIRKTATKQKNLHF